jgi:hypothetical protein
MSASPDLSSKLGKNTLPPPTSFSIIYSNLMGRKKMQHIHAGEFASTPLENSSSMGTTITHESNRYTDS